MLEHFTQRIEVTNYILLWSGWYRALYLHRHRQVIRNKSICSLIFADRQTHKYANIATLRAIGCCKAVEEITSTGSYC